MIFRIAISRLNNFLSKNLDIRIILFISRLQLLNKCEKEFIKKIIQLEKGSIYNLYKKNMLIKDPSDFLIKKKIKKTSINDIYLNHIKIISVSKEIEQVKIVEKLVYKMIKNGVKPYKIGLILGDKYLAIPLFNSLKKILGKNLSISINYPLKNLPIHSTFFSIFELLLKKEKLKKFYGKDILRILSDGYIQKFFIKKNLSFIVDKWNTENSNFIPESTINKYLSKSDINIIFQIKTHNTKKCIIGILSFIRKLKILFFSNSKKHLLELKFLSKLEIYMQKIKILVRKAENHFFGIKDLFNIYKQFINTEKIPYRRNNPKGLHIIEFMESNFENFENTIITSVNEGFIPTDRIKKYNTFIPFDIRNKFNLPIFQENEEIYHYHFRKILRNSRNIYLIYKNQPDELNSGEKSRFIHQIEISSKLITEKKKNFPFLFSKSKISPIVIKKTESMIQRLDKISTNGLSPSSINLYNYNPLLFYYKKILGLNDPEKISLKQQVGKIIHKILEILYHPIKGYLITIDWINKMKKNYEYITEKVLLKSIKNPFIKGKNMLINSIIKNYIKNFISWEEKFVHKGHKILIKELEFSTSTILDIGNHKVNLYGIIDRIDEYDGITRIIDYKIGISKTKKIHIPLNKIENIFQDPNYRNTMQLLIYMYLWFKSTIFLGCKIHPPIISIVSPEKDKNNSILTIPVIFFHQKKKFITYECYVKIFLPLLINKISEILNPKIPIIEKKISDF
ncbi:PD-(D/E)XK nuclease family protein [Blattabacterium sp. (Cryptocercus kyebangensis)]|uniref:PD-(D/E)XK nuclease family protein n=1 Tax=Blattabacterium sp. (Cryptocercus kyebangensis) TaxID=298656 RepID=UPI001F19B0B9|nr:PD-(D/E)XK nuclease family protein [Blattabacterium sp. (Cryptocercus kyebangensis)]